MLFQILLAYLFIVNAAGFLLMLIDKIKAKKNTRRIPEKVLFLVALLGGSLGSLLGMYTFRHKTKHLSFVFGMPLIFAAQILIAVLIMDLI